MLEDAPGKYTATFEATFKSESSAGGADRTGWDIQSIEKLESPGWYSWGTGLAIGAHAKAIEEAWSRVQTRFEPYGALPAISDDPFFKWVRNPVGNEPKLSPFPLAVALNSLVRSGAIQPKQPLQILSSFVDRHLTVEIRGMPHGEPSWFYMENQEVDSTSRHKLPWWDTLLGEMVLVYPQLFFVRPKAPANVKRLTSLRDEISLRRTFYLLQSHRILHEYTVLQYSTADNGAFSVRLREKNTLVPYPKGRICKCIPIPGPHRKHGTSGQGQGARSEREPLAVMTPEVVIESPHIVKALKQLSRVWQDKFAKSVLISAPPGSGKENFANSIPYGNGRRADTFRTVSLASGDKTGIETQLYGRRRDDGSIEEGLISQAAESALFLDEVHQPEDNPEIRASLLRPIEADEYYPVGSNKAEPVRNVLFILATSRSLQRRGTSKTIRDIKPVDFWTRMTHVIEIDHFLQIADTPEEDFPPSWRSDALRALFKFFWWQRFEQFYGQQPALADVGLWRNASMISYTGAEILFHRQAIVLLDEDMLKDRADQFADSVISIQGISHLPQLSIRGLRSIVTRVFSIAASLVASGQVIWHKQDCDAKKKLDAKFLHSLRSAISEVSEIATLET